MKNDKAVKRRWAEHDTGVQPVLLAAPRYYDRWDAGRRPFSTVALGIARESLGIETIRLKACFTAGALELPWLFLHLVLNGDGSGGGEKARLEIQQRPLTDVDEALMRMHEIEDQGDHHGDEERQQRAGKTRPRAIGSRAVAACEAPK
jgi:hypothetical protein